ncbi:hypothetical protein TTHERM_00343490 (macronuclear) [Tetrahymena thermophila SB210]|uniref:Uncharacterized protein n=1 Tax=Tetrahymena thermophila (strain SB210) TaxID=312017 RepID=I7M8G8_TETTS|nr:hypothetical protein TTHERM_00343490 [Tetrahymena thermophila SB210]EAR98150.2 hypothetical protein TTHERM_00343490 [Tetrahymena thermophila SB210]|eukprot:XP_001018395.2 hypothetical protein TTHERM_00343490 [Tetrahymena thermophila SB210]
MIQQVKDLKTILSNEVSSLQFNGSDQMFINEIEALQFKDEFIKLIRQCVNQINSKLQKDRETILQNYQKIFSPKKVGQKKLDQIRDLIEESEINKALQQVKRKYELILLNFQSNNEPFNLQFISPLTLDQNIKSIFRLHEEFYMTSQFSLNENCNQFIKRYKSIISNEQCPLIMFDRFSINLLLKNSDDNTEEINKQDFELYMNGFNMLSSNELVITAAYLQQNVMLGLGRQKIMKITQNVKRILLESSGIECFDFIFKSKQINYLQINRMYMCQMYDFANFFDNMDEQQVDIGEIVISDIPKTQDILDISYFLSYYQQLLNYQFLLRIYAEDEQKPTYGFYQKPNIKSQIQENIQENQNEDIDVYLKTKQQEQLYENKQEEQLLNRKFNFFGQPCYEINLLINEEISSIFNLKYSSQLMAITIDKLFKGQFSIYRILYDLYQI